MLGPKYYEWRRQQKLREEKREKETGKKTEFPLHEFLLEMAKEENNDELAAKRRYDRMRKR